VKPARIIHLVARRGNAAECPENSLSALRSALELGARFLLVDVQVSADGVPLLTREFDLRYLNGEEGRIGDRAAALLRELEVSERRRFGDRFAGTRLATLEEAVALAAKRPEITLLVELHEESLAHLGRDVVVTRVLDALRPVRSQAALVSTDVPAIHRARELGGIAIGWTLRETDSHSRIKCEALQPDYVLCERRVLPPAGTLWRGHWRWLVHDVADIEAALELARRGVDFVATGEVRAMRDAMQRLTSA
jgi:glycerophosphoryl diester phosphodiesterase